MHAIHRPRNFARVVRAASLRSVRTWGVVALSIFVVGGCSGLSSRGDAASEALRARLAVILPEVKGGLRPLALSTGPSQTSAESEYFREYGLDPVGVPHHFGTLRSGASTLSVHVYLPAGAKETVLLLHGYYDHVGTHGLTIGDLIGAGYAVVAFDLPGHGLSSGPRAEIEDFADYREALRDVLEGVREGVPSPISFVGHSAGCPAVIDLLLSGRENPFQSTVLVAPLVHSKHWGPSKFGAAVVGWFVDSVPRRSPTGSSDPEFVRARAVDPLQFDRFPLGWYYALRAWEQRIAGLEPISGRMLVLQGDRDDTVDAKFNVAFLESKFPDAQVIRFTRGEHLLLNEIPAVRNPVIAAMLRFLEEGAASP